MGLGKTFAIGYLSTPNPNSFLSFLALHAGDKQDRGQENKFRAQRHLAAVLLRREGWVLFLKLDCLTVVITTYWSSKILNIHGLSLEIPPSIGKLVYISDFQLQLQISSY